MKTTRLFFHIILFFSALLIIGCAAKKTVRFTMNTVEDVNAVVDSIMESGTAISAFEEIPFVKDDSVLTVTKLATLYKNGEATGSIQVNETPDGKFVIKIIDTFTEKKEDKK